MAEIRPVPPLKVFLSYSHKDEEFRERFRVHLSELEREGLIQLWHDRRITAGTEWAGAIDEHLNSAHLIILLVSADFLASDYCNDVEMNRALERSRQGEARVIPVILKPCDWQTSRFASLQALPEGGKPVVDWKTEDHGFNNVVKGLRQVLMDICGPVPVRTQVFRIAVRRHPLRWAAALLSAVVLLLGWQLWSRSQDFLRQGTDLLNVGQYAPARLALQQAKLLNPFNRTAKCGLEAVDLDALRFDRVRFEQRLGESSRTYPQCAYLNVLRGDEKYRLGDRQGALAEYREAVKREPQLAEAHFDIGRILDLEGDPDSALPAYAQAAKLSPGTPRYHNNLADLYFRREEYDNALAEYNQISEFPLAALEAAQIYRLQGKLSDALGREQDAIRWLNDPSIRKAEEGTAWVLEISPVEGARLGPIREKQCYAELEAAVTEFLGGDERKADSAISSAFAKCSSRQKELKQILKWELERLGSQAPALRQRSDEIVQRFFASGT
jgi:tetratricopeptide (TPR) repeat protein